jgi:hypothetical protein
MRTRPVSRVLWQRDVAGVPIRNSAGQYLLMDFRREMNYNIIFVNPFRFSPGLNNARKNGRM